MKYKPEIVVKWFASFGLDAEAEHKFHPSRKWRFDFAFVKERVAIECQGGIFSGGRHVRGAALLKEHEKLNAAACLGWRVLFVTPDSLCMSETLEMVKEAVSPTISLEETGINLDAHKSLE
jgi:hypothetical protein